MTDVEDRAIDAVEEATTSLEAIDDDSIPAQIREEQKIVDTLSDELAECYLDGLNMSEGRFAQAISDASRLTKTEAKQEIKRKINESQNQDATRLNVWISENLTQVRVIRTTDHISDTRYVWEFSDETTVETGSNQRTHFMWPEFRDEIYDAAGPYLMKPDDGYLEGDDWRRFVVRLIQEYKNEKESIGRRTRAIEYLKTRIRNADGFGDLRDAADYQGVYVEVNNDPPDDEAEIDTSASNQECPLWRVDLLMFPNNWAKDAAEEHDITTRAVQNELDSRGFTIDGRRVSSTEYIGGRYQTFWKLNGSFASPAAYQPIADDDHQTESDSDGDDEPDSDISADDSESDSESDSDSDVADDAARDQADDSDDDSDWGAIGGEL
jgi:hypothetical protein